MSRTDWYGGLRWVSETDSIPASLAARVVVEAAEASDRMRDVRQVLLAPVTQEFTPHENALWRALSERFPPHKCTQLVLRARAAASEIVGGS